jgi:protein-disulfide isomerase
MRKIGTPMPTPKKLFRLVAFVALTAALFAQNNVEKLQILKPPPGAKVAIVSFEDFECPDCGRAHPLLLEMSKKYNVPIVRHDFPLPQHPWAMDAAVIHRYIESKNPKVASDYRDEVYKNQPQFGEDASAFRNWVTQWAAAHGVPLPFVMDPNGQFAAAIKADQDLGRRVNIDHTPTIYVVTSNRAIEPFVEVVDRTQLAQMIEDAKQKAASTPSSAAPKKAATTRKPS